jgi:hypothetical protein
MFQHGQSSEKVIISEFSASEMNSHDTLYKAKAVTA